MKDNELKPELNEELTAEPAVSRRSRNNSAASGAKTILLYLHDFVYLLGIILVVLLVCFRIVVVSGPSMRQTLLDGDSLILLTRTFYRTPQQGDIVVISKASYDNGEPIVKRVIATENQWVDIDFAEGIVYVGDTKDDLKPMNEPYTNTPTNLFEGVSFPRQVPEGCIFVLGDNRNESKDSRSPEIDMIDTREVLGKAIFLFFPGTDGGRTERDFGRIGGLD